MSTTLRAPAPGASPPDLLAAVAHVLGEAADTDLGPIAVGVHVDDDGFSLATRALDNHPAIALLGFTAPPEWNAFGVMVRGTTRAYPAEPAGPPPEVIGVDERISLVHLVARDGSHRSRIVPDDGEPVDLGDGAAGALHDTCCRVLGLPTAPPPCSPLVYWAGCWLEAVAQAADQAAEPLDWPAVAARHMAIALCARREPELVEPATRGLYRLGPILASARSWDQLRTEWADGDGHAGLTPEELAWMDAGIFARWCLGSLPDIERLVERCAPDLTPEADARLRAVLAAWDLPRPPIWKEADR